MKVDFSNLPQWMNKKYYQLLRDSNRLNIVYGGAGSGKSVFVAQRAVFRGSGAEPGHNLLIIRKVGRTNRISTFPQILSVIGQWGLNDLFKVNKSDLEITCSNGNGIRFAGLDDVEKIKSVTFERGPVTDIWVEEATEITEADYNQLSLRLRGKARVPFQITPVF